ncbi:hypothetical protein, partial [Streptomyces sp. NPDC047070]|uniref:hypothetical protein n=1 Tax=Streptomyces sp. NPDC047070 TaxID=3154923 RepID=UPI003454D000
MDPVTVGVVMTVALSVVDAIVKIDRRRVTADVEIARITEASQHDRIRDATSGTAIADGRPHHRAAALFEALCRLPALEHSNALFGVTVA